MSEETKISNMTRREMMGTVGKAAAASVAITPLMQTLIVSGVIAADEPLNAIAGVDRVTVLPGKTYLMGWAGFGGEPARQGMGGRGGVPAAPTPASIDFQMIQGANPPRCSLMPSSCRDPPPTWPPPSARASSTGCP